MYCFQTAEEIKESMIELPDCLTYEAQTFHTGSETYLIMTIHIREETTFTLEIGHSYSLVQYGNLQLFTDRIEIEQSYTKGYKTDFVFYKFGNVIARIPLEREV